MDVVARRSPRRRQGAVESPPDEAGSIGPRGQAASKSPQKQMAPKSPPGHMTPKSPDQMVLKSRLRNAASDVGEMVPFRRPSSPPKKRPKLKSRGGKELEEEDEEYFKVNFENLMEFLKLRMDPKALDIVTVNDLATPPEMWFDFYLCRVGPVEERLDAFRAAHWMRMCALLKRPLPAFILDVEPLKKWSRLQDQDCKNNWVLRKRQTTQDECKFQQDNANSSKQAVVGTRMPTDRVTASRKALMTTKEELITLIQQVLSTYRRKGKLTRRSEQSLMEMIKTGKVPDDLVDTIDPLMINLFVNRLRILQMKKKSRHGPVFVLNDFSTS